jgi:transmembrane sensor
MNVSFKDLLHKYNTGTCTPEEKAAIESWYQQLELTDLAQLSEEHLQEIKALVPVVPIPVKRRALRPWLAAAASIALLIGVASFFFLHRHTTTTRVPVIASLQNDVLPGSNKAMLTLSNGKTIVLADAKNGQLAQQGQMIVEKKADGVISYTDTQEQGETAETASMFNTVSTPRGGQHHLVLSDGTQVWLNAASSIRYPVTFTGATRSVEVSGEAYFEVAPNAASPFKVISRAQTIEVIGTYFNVNSYTDEHQIKTTLLEGAVRVVADAGNTVILKPDQQATLQPGGQLMVSNADVETAIDWKNGDFVFSNQTLPDIMRKIARWYDVDINYGNYKNSPLTFSGVVSRAHNLSAVLTMLESTTKVKFIIRNNQITITDNKKED